MATLTFNLSTKNKKIFDEEYFQKEYYQIMPSTQRVLTMSTIDSYPQINNPNILIHMNYITYVFNAKSIENTSIARRSLQMYNRLADKLGTKNILIHMPKSKKEFEYLKFGLQVIYDELISKGKTLQFEIVPWDKELQELFNLRDDPIKAIKRFLNIIIKNSFDKNFNIVFDTAHLHALGLDGNSMCKLIDHYLKYVSYIHLNGNMNSMFTSDKHAIIFSNANKFVNSIDPIVRYCSEHKLVCVMEITQERTKYENYKIFANRYGFRLVNDYSDFSY